jgi:anhydro-N-acetylmuramic acid kinase
MKATFLKMATEPIDDLQKQLRKLAAGRGNEFEIKKASLEIGIRTRKAISKLGMSDIDLIALHGQTIFHEPPNSLQLIDPSSIVSTFDCTVLTHPRAADLELGGQGAPITPLADWILFRDAAANTAVINLGGFCNITMLPMHCQPSEILGFDLCCCNVLLDAIARTRLRLPFDQSGKCALQGKVQNQLFYKLENKLQEQYDQHRSLGSNDDLGMWFLDQGKDVETNDLLATTTKSIGSFIQSITASADRIFIAGGGVHNESLVQAIGKKAQKTDALGVPTQAREGMAMAILGVLATDGVSITLPQITGRRETSEVVGWTQASP